MFVFFVFVSIQWYRVVFIMDLWDLPAMDEAAIAFLQDCGVLPTK